MAIGTPSACTITNTYPSGTSRQSNALTVAANDLMVAWVTWEDDSPSSITFSDTGGNTWSTLTKQEGSGPRVCMGWAVASANQTNNRVTATFNASMSAIQIGFLAVSGCDTSSPFDQQNGGTGSSTSPSAGSVTTTQADEIIIVAGKSYGAVGWSSWLGGSGTELVDTGDTMGVGYQIVSSTGTYTGNATMDNQAWAMVVASFKAAGGTSHSASVTFSGTGDLSAAGTQAHAASASLTGAGDLSATAVRTQFGSVAFDGAGDLAAAAVRTQFGSPAFAGAGDLSADGTVTNPGGTSHSASVAFDGAGDLSVSAVRTQFGAAAMTGAGALAATAALSLAASVAFDAAGSLAVSATVGAVVPQLGGASTAAAARRTGTVARGGPTTAARGVTSTTTTLGRTTTRARGE
jgi:hypothetical protein